MAEQRIQKVLSDQGVCSRRAAEKLIDEGRVKVNGRAARISYDTQLECPTVEVPATDIRKEIRIEIFG